MRRSLLSLCVLVVSALTAPVLAAEVDLPRNPSLSPNGKQVVFSWRGDLWKVASSGGQAVRLTSHAASELRSAWSPDGKWIAFNSRRSGALNIHVMKADGTALRQVTRSDLSLVLAGWGHGGKTLLFHAHREGEIHWGSRPYSVPVAGGPYARLHDAYGHSPALGPKGTRLAFVRGRSSWTRRHYRGPANRDLWLYDYATARFQRLTRWRGNDGMPTWRDANTLVFASDREFKTVNLFSLDLRAKQPKQGIRRLTSFRGQDVQDVDVARDGSRAVFVVWDTIYTLDLSDAQAKPVKLAVTAPGDAADRFVRKKVGRSVSEAALSPDGKTLACVAYGRVFVRTRGKRRPTKQVTRGHARARELTWSPDGKRLYFVSDRGGSESIYAAEVGLTRGEIRTAFRKATAPSRKLRAKGPGPNGAKVKKRPQGLRWQGAITFRVTPVVVAAYSDRRPSPSPDGKRLAFKRNRGDLMVLDLGTNKVRRLVKSWDRYLHWSWSPDSRHLAYSINDRDFNAEVWIARVDGSGEPVNISMHPDGDWNPQWSADGRVLAFLSSRMQDQTDVYMVYLDRALEQYAPWRLERYYAEAAKAAAPRPKGLKGKAKGKSAKKRPAKPVQLSLKDAYRRLRRVTNWPASESDFLMSPAGDRFYVNTGNPWDRGPGKRVLYSVKYDGTEKKPLARDLELHQLDRSGRQLVFVSKGRAGVLPVAGRKPPKPVFEDLSATLKIDLAEQSSQKFLEASRILSTAFYHPTMKGLDWRALTERYHALAKRARTADEFREVGSRLVGELNASHLGIRPPPERSPNAAPNGRLGTDHESVDDGFKITRIVPGGPAEKAKLAVGDVIVEIDRQPFTKTDTLEGRLRGRVSKDSLLTVLRPRGEGTEPLELLVLLRPITYRAERNLRYDAWQRGNAAKVAKWSQGRIGYLHIRGMNLTSLVEFERDLYAAGYRKDALLIDVRNNGGGWTADRVLASLMVRPHAYTVPRGADPAYTEGYPQGRLFIQRYTRPVNMLCNENSFSNAEILSHGFKTLKRGTLVGEQTYGGVISTGGARLIDGTFVRVPFRGWYLPDGTDMENNGAVPDLRVPQTPEDESAGIDRQLRAATRDLLKRLPKDYK